MPVSGRAAVKPRGELLLDSADYYQLVLPFYKAGGLELAEIYAADCLGRMAGVHDAQVLLAAALALRAPRLGHVGVELEMAASRVAMEVNLDLPWPAAALWLGKIAACKALVDCEGGGQQPFVLVGEDARPCADGRPLRLLSRRYFRLEQDAARRIRELLQAPLLMESNRVNNLTQQALRAVEATDELRRVVAASLSRRLVVLTGGPGSGKTFAAKFILYAHWLAGGRQPPEVALAAPTGKAAQRLKQALQEDLERCLPDAAARCWVQSLEPLTLHRLLEAGRGWPRRFARNTERPLTERLIIVDEASMVDLDLMDRLLAALDSERDQTLVLVGDEHQLASVEAGCVLRDLAVALDGKEDVYVRLSSQHRVKNKALSELARLVLEGRSVQVLDLLRAGQAEGLTFIPLAGERLSEQAISYLRENLAGHVQALSSKGEELLVAWQEFGLLTPYRHGALGVDGLNKLLCKMLRELVPERFRLEGWFDDTVEWYPGRLTLVSENRYDLGLFNGDMGVALPHQGKLLVRFPSGDFSPSLLSGCQTAFAVTVHKAQGSQFERVALVLGDGDSPFLTRELVYTAITRARRELVLIGRIEDLERALCRAISRASGLDRLL